VALSGFVKMATLGDVRCDLLEHAEQFRSEARLHDREAGHIAAGMSKALHPAVRDRIAAADENDGNGSGQLLHRCYRSIAVCQHHIRLIAQQPPSGGSYPIRVARPPVIIDLKIPADIPAQLLELAPKYLSPNLSLRIALGVQHEHADPASLLKLRACGKRPRRRATNQCNEFAPPHCLPRGLARH
jgi:hypothetical protein